MSRSSSDDIIAGYIEEVKTYIPSLVKGIKTLRDNPKETGVLEEVHRLVHTIKGASSMVGIYGLSHIAYQMEDTLDDIIGNKLSFTNEAFRVMSRTIDYFKAYCDDFLENGVNAQEMLTDTVIAYRRLRGLPPNEDDQTLEPLLEAVPRREGGSGGEIEQSQRQYDQQSTVEVSEIAPDERDEDADYSTLDDLGTEDLDMDDFLESFEQDQDDLESEEEEEMESWEEEPGQPTIPEPIPELLESFYEEAEEHLEDIGRSLNILESQIIEPVTISMAQREEIRRIRRSVHTLKGASAVIGLPNVSTWAHKMEDLLDWLYEKAETVYPDIISILSDSASLLERIVAKPQDPQTDKVQSFQSVYQSIMGKKADKQPPAPKAPSAGKAAVPKTPIAPVPEVPAQEIEPEAEEEQDMEPLVEGEIEGTIAREADEIPSDLTVPTTKTLRVGMERVDELVNLVGELLIASSAFDQKMDFFGESINELDLSRDRLRDIAREMEVGFEVKALERAKSDKAETWLSAVRDETGFEDFDDLELDRYTKLNLIIRTLNESVIDVGAINTHLSNILSDFDGHLTRLRVLLSELQDKMMRVRMTPMATITNKLRRTVREVSTRLGKKIRFVIEGAGIELDRVVWEKITDPLMHLLRNAADHGIEPPALRQALGKPHMGTLKLSAHREGNQVVIRVEDDGAGLNYQGIRNAVKSGGFVENVEKMTDEELIPYIFRPGFSTRGKISEVSGRGVGMDVVKENIQNLKGSIKVSSSKGKGTRFTIRIPLTLAAVRALLFMVGGETFAMALNEVSEIIRIDSKDITQDLEAVVKIGDEVLPLYYFSDMLGFEEVADDSSEQDTEEDKKAEKTAVDFPMVLVVDTAGRRGAFVIDSLIGQREIVIKSLGSHLHYVPGISGATIMGDGSVVPILNVETLIGRSSTSVETADIDEVPVIEKPIDIMVVDDSVSIRQVVSRLMEDQGWKVQTAKDGIDALEKLRENRPDLIVLDIEMPRMNGYEFLGAIRAQPAYREIPVVMLTSRTAAKHREKAMSLGAKGFIVKPYDDDEFVNLVLELTGNG